MEKNSSIGRRVFFVVSVLAIVVLVLILERGFIYTLLKLPEMRMPYMMFFSIFLFCSLIFYAMKIRTSLFKGTILGIAIGQIIGTVSLTMANLFIPNGIARNLASLRREGVFELFLTDTTIAFILGGWLLGGIAFLLYGLLEIKFSGSCCDRENT